MNQTQLSATQIWGDHFEIAVKRGALYCLLEEKLITPETPGLDDWRKSRVKQVIRHVLEQLEIRDSHQEAQNRVEDYCKHQLVTGYGLGWTVMRTWLQQVQTNYDGKPQYKDKPLRLERLWSPLALPARTLDQRESDAQCEERLAYFGELMGIRENAGENWAARGQPPQADFLLAVRGPDEQLHALCLEFSLNALPEPGDFRAEQAHLDELSHYVRLIERRGVFSRITAEVSAGEFELSDRMIDYMSALTTRDKPLYKLLQGCSYLREWVRLMSSRQQFQGEVQAQVIAVTAAGLEAMHAVLGQDDAKEDAKAKLMSSFGMAYRNMSKQDVITEDHRKRQADNIFHHLAKALPETLREALRRQLQEANTKPESSYELVLRETLRAGEKADFINPNTQLPRETLLNWACANDGTKEFFTQPLQQALAQSLDDSGKGEHITLRDIHAAGIHAALREAKANNLTVLGLEGHPGIGKTTAMLEAVKRLSEGWLFIYVSPRVVINDEVTQILAGADDVLAMTTNYVLNSGAADWYAQHGETYDSLSIGKPDSAVRFNHPPNFTIPHIGTLFLRPEQADQVTGDLGRTGYKSRELDYQTRKIYQTERPGVMKTLAQACKAALKANPRWNKVVLTGSIQSYRALASGTTIDRLLRQLFDTPENTKELDERFAPRIRNIIVMVDEITGDGAGAHVVHEFADALRKYFLKPYQRERRDSPFRLILAVADASLGNEAMLRSYLEEDAALRRHEAGIPPSSPEKILVSPGRPEQPFGLACLEISLGGHGKKTPALHIMADSFPASRLDIEYRVAMTPLCLEKRDDALQRPHEAIREKTGESTLRLAVACIFQELANLANGEQVILFAQDKPFLRKLEAILQSRDELHKLKIPQETWVRLESDDIAKLDSSVGARQRRHLMRTENRDRVRVWLMTSSGSRGISFPKVSRIIAFVPRFAVEGGLMEIAQLIYRGRGGGGDELDRKLVLLIQDFIFYETGETLDTVLWTRRTVDIVTMLVLLRATIMTRIKGHADIQGQEKISLVPVGKIASDEMVQTISEALRGFLGEAENSMLDKTLTEDVHNAAGKAWNLAHKVFPKLDWSNRQNIQNPLSIVQVPYMRSFTHHVCQPHHALLEKNAPEPLPGNVVCTGPLAFEHWRDGQTSETLAQEKWDKQFEADLRHLTSLLGVIGGERDFPDKLRGYARDLRDIINDYGKEISHEHRTIKQVATNRVWVSLPVDYPRFLIRENLDGESSYQRLQHPEEWLDILSSAARLYATPSASHPVSGNYVEYPFFAMISQDDPTHLSRTLNSRYFSATAETNLLNVLFVGSPVRAA